MNAREQVDAAYFLDLPTLIQQKLTARRFQDYADVVRLIGTHALDELFAARLYPSFRRAFIDCVEAHRRELEYEARQDEQLEDLQRKMGYPKQEG